MTESSSTRYKTARSIRIACGLLFILFSVCYLCFQSPLLEMLQKVLSEGQTTYSPQWGTWIITLILCLLQWGVSAWMRLPERWHALTYIPSFLLLSFVTDVHKDIYEAVTLGRWMWLLPLSLLLFWLLSWSVRRLEILLGDYRNQKGWSTLMPNLLTMYLLSVGCVSLGNTDELFHNEAAADAALLHGDYQKVMEIGAGSGRTSRELTVMRVYALSRMDSLPDRLFDYPLHDGTRGLLLDAGVATTWLRADSLYAYLGGTPRQGESITGYLRRLCYTDTGNHPVLDYYLCALLLRKELEVFVKELDYFCYVEEGLPKAYAEALYLYYRQHPSLTPPYDFADLEQAYEHYRKASPEDRRHYWYYYDHTTIRYEK